MSANEATWTPGTPPQSPREVRREGGREEVVEEGLISTVGWAEEVCCAVVREILAGLSLKLMGILWSSLIKAEVY